MVAEHGRCIEPNCVVIDRFGKLEVQESMGCSGSPDRRVEVQGKVDLAMGTIFCGKPSNQMLLVLISQPILGQVTCVTAIILSKWSSASPPPQGPNCISDRDSSRMGLDIPKIFRGRLRVVIPRVRPLVSLTHLCSNKWHVGFPSCL